MAEEFLTVVPGGVGEGDAGQKKDGGNGVGAGELVSSYQAPPACKLVDAFVGDGVGEDELLDGFVGFFRVLVIVEGDEVGSCRVFRGIRLAGRRVDTSCCDGGSDAAGVSYPCKIFTMHPLLLRETVLATGLHRCIQLQNVGSAYPGALQLVAVVRRELVKQDRQTEQKKPSLFSIQEQAAALVRICVHDKEQGEQCLHARAGIAQVYKGYPGR